MFHNILHTALFVVATILLTQQPALAQSAVVTNDIELPVGWDHDLPPEGVFGIEACDWRYDRDMTNCNNDHRWLVHRCLARYGVSVGTSFQLVNCLEDADDRLLDCQFDARDRHNWCLEPYEDDLDDILSNN